ncbi:MAG: alpha/beta hydrolase [Gammaproteobacteria bacterium]|nr:alpha/beta hydrolase [Gammaproteobacteria bacterium]
MNLELEIRPGRRLHIETNTHFSHKPTAFCIHGLGGSGEQWREQVRLLDPHFNLVIPDLLGHGQSDKPKPHKTNPYSFIEFSQDLELLFEKFSTSQNIVLGHSYGGALATLLAYNHQSKVNKLILIAPGRCQPNTQIPSIYRLPVFLLELMRPYLEKNFQQNAFDPADSPKLINTESRAGKMNRLYVIKSTLLGMKDVPALDMRTLSISTLILTGESDRIIPANISKDFYEKIPQHRYFLLEKSGHMLMLEQPDEVNNIIKHDLAL